LKKLPDLHLIAQFLSVVDAPSMAALARELGVSTAAVSQSISKLEKNFGVSLLERGVRRNRMTPAGAILRQRARHLLDTLQDLLDELDEYKDTEIPHLRIYIIESLARTLAPSLVMNLSNTVKNLSVETRYRFDAVGDLLNDTFDMVISTETAASDPSIENIFLAKERLIALFPKDARNLTLGELAGTLPFIRFNRFDRFNAKLNELLKNRNLSSARTFECTSLPAVVELINNGFGWTIATPLRMSHFLPLYPNLSASVFADPFCERDVYMLVHKERFLDLPASAAQVCREALVAQSSCWTELVGEGRPQPIEVPPMERVNRSDRVDGLNERTPLSVKPRSKDYVRVRRTSLADSERIESPLDPRR
jgi:DNA-binding transcriptional LysR family regulator